ncbi:hypothetical protein Dimus_002059 [Dionaea muscipula]
MALLSSPPLLSVSPVSSTATATTMAFVSSLSSPPVGRFRWQATAFGLNHKLACGLRICAPLGKNRGHIVAMAADGDDQGPAPDDGKSGDEEKSIPIEDLPLESKLQMQLDQKMRMKIAKKIRLRRKRLVRKRRLRKKGRWPPSKMKKLKNV